MQYLLLSIFHVKFAKIDNLSELCSLDNSCKKPYENWQLFPTHQVKSKRKHLNAPEAFPYFSFVCFHWKITWHLGKVTKEVKTESSCLVFLGLNVPACWLPKTTNKLLLQNLYHFIYDIQKTFVQRSAF